MFVLWTILIVALLVILGVLMVDSVKAQELLPTSAPTPIPDTEPYLLIHNLYAPTGSTIAVPVKFYGSDINAITFELEHSEGLEFVSIENHANPPFVGSCNQAERVFQCAVYGYGMDGDEPITIPQSDLFTLKFIVRDEGTLTLFSYSFGSKDGQSVPGTAQGGTIFLRDVINPPTSTPEAYPEPQGPTSITIDSFTAKSSFNLMRYVYIFFLGFLIGMISIKVFAILQERFK
jgi:hypothetical protein